MTEETPSSPRSTRLGLHLSEDDARRIRAAFSRSSAVVRTPSFSAWCVEVLLREVATIELQENAGRRFTGGQAGELSTGRPIRSEAAPRSFNIQFRQ